MGKEYAPLFLNFNETTSALTDEECGRLVRAYVDYANGIEPELTGSERILFPVFKAIIDGSNKLSEIRRDAVSSRYENKHTEPEIVEEDDTNSTNGYKHLQNEQTSTNSTIKDKSKKIKDKSKTVNGKDYYFDQFWATYPRKVSKETARKAFLKLNPDEDLLSVMIEAIERQKQSPQWRDVQFIPHPATWINGKRWEDEITNEKEISNDGISRIDAEFEERQAFYADLPG